MTLKLFEKTFGAINTIKDVVDKAESYDDITDKLTILFDEDLEQIDFSYPIDDEYILQGIIKRNRGNNFFYIEQDALFEVWKDNGCTACFVMTTDELNRQMDRLNLLDQ